MFNPEQSNNYDNDENYYRSSPMPQSRVRRKFTRALQRLKLKKVPSIEEIEPENGEFGPIYGVEQLGSWVGIDIGHQKYD